VRELRNVLERASHLAASAGRDTISELPELTVPAPPADEPTAEELYRFDEANSYHEARGRVESHFEERYVLWLLERHGGNISAAARAAKMDRKYLSELVRRYRRG
jgi:DNA-binding NtrC family response regulator